MDFGRYDNGQVVRSSQRRNHLLDRTVGNLSAPSSRAGTYYLVFDNSFSLLSQKTIAADIGNRIRV